MAASSHGATRLAMECLPIEQALPSLDGGAPPSALVFVVVVVAVVVVVVVFVLVLAMHSRQAKPPAVAEIQVWLWQVPGASL